MALYEQTSPASSTSIPGSASPLLDIGERAFWIGFSIVVLSIISASATYFILTGLTPIPPRDSVVIITLFTNVILIIAMIGVIAAQGRDMWKAWQKKVPGARLHIRIVLLFSLIAAIPTMLVAVAATTTFSRTLESWFTTRARTIISNSLDVARAYVDEHGRLLRTDLANMVRDVDAAAKDIGGSNKALKQVVISQAILRGMPLAFVLDYNGKPAIKALDEPRLTFSPVQPDSLQEALAGKVVLTAPRGSPRVSAIAKLNEFPDKFLYVARELDPKVVGNLRRTEASVNEYRTLRKARSGLKIAHGLIYAMISMTALLAAIWAGLWFASRFVAPIRRLIAAAQQVSEGNLRVELPERRGEGDLRRLSTTFNRMTREIKNQRDALVTANEQLVERRRFMEAVLSGVSAGVIGLDSQDRITLLSRSACELLSTTEEDVVGERLVDVFPTLAPILTTRDEKGVRPRVTQEFVIPIDGEERNFAVALTREKAGDGDVGSVVTFDDITELVTAQRTTAWADVARRIAHEIKNPLTPIILSAERIRRKYGKVIDQDRETFDKLTATIERQAGDIKSMVDEFASFARIPKPVMEHNDLKDAVMDSVILYKESHSGVSYKTEMPDTPLNGMFDRRLLTQAVTNLIKNATEAAESAAEGKPAKWKPEVEIVLSRRDPVITIEIIDNGPGLPKANRTRLLEPYVTTKGHKGTGLGLAIVQKITEQHGGQLLLDDAPQTKKRKGGARVTIALPVSILDQPASPAVEPETTT